jgi:hypothetical protein
MAATADEGATGAENAIVPGGKKQKLRGRPRVYVSSSDHHHEEETQHEIVPEGSRYCVLI